jgi:hypothetical protein
MMQKQQNVKTLKLALLRSSSLSTGLDQLANQELTNANKSQVFKRGVLLRPNRESNLTSTTDETFPPLSTDKSIKNFAVIPSDILQPKNIGDDTNKGALEQIKHSCDTVITNKNNEISNRKLPREIAKGFSIAGTLTTVATILFITLAQPTLLVFAASIIVLCIAITALLISGLFNIATDSDTIKDNCHAFIANTLKDMEFKNLADTHPDALKTLNNIITYYLNGSTPIELEPFIKLKSLNRTDIDEKTQDEKAQKCTTKVLENFIEILKISFEEGHKKAKNITREFLEAFKEDIATYTDTLTASKVRTLANLPPKEPNIV